MDEPKSVAAGARNRRGKVRGKASAAVAKPGFLGRNAKSSAAPQTDQETGEVSSTKKPAGALRCERFAMQSGVRTLLPTSRTAKCLRLRQQGQDVQVIQSKQHKTCSYKNLQTCGSVWACPVCAAKISERRRVELKTAIDAHIASGGAVYLLTLTNAHHYGDDLPELLAGQAKALSYFNGDRASRKVFAAMACIGQIRALEVTHGRLRRTNNGWHPHYHVLLFAAAGIDLADFQARLAERWMSACSKAGLKAPSLEHGVKLDSGTHAAKYAAKWGLDSEMTKGHIKKATDGESPFDLLRAYVDNDDKQAGALFCEFADSFKGKRQLYWSAGLKKRFQIGEMTDEELAAKHEDKAALLGKLTLDQWRYILKKDARAIVLDLAEKGWPAVERFLSAMPAKTDAVPVDADPVEPKTIRDYKMTRKKPASIDSGVSVAAPSGVEPARRQPGEISRRVWAKVGAQATPADVIQGASVEAAAGPLSDFQAGHAALPVFPGRIKA